MHRMAARNVSVPKDSTALIQISKARRALASAKSLDDLLSIRDQSEVVRQLLKVQGHSLDSQNEAADIKCVAERKLGETLAKMERVGHRPQKGAVAAPFKKTLADNHIAKTQARRWQLMASVPEEVYTKHVTDIREANKELTSVSVQNLGRRQSHVNGKPAAEFAPSFDTDIITDLDQLGDERFGTIYADPPWSYTNHATRANVRDKYAGTMTPEQIAAMPVLDHVLDDAHLHLWVTKDFIFEAHQIIQAWGFTYKSMFVWVKPQMGIGNYWRVSHELLLLGVRGDAKRFGERNHMSWGSYDRGEHSAKPEAIRHVIERVSPGPYLELFGKKKVQGWKVLGNQIGKRLFPA